MNIAINERLNIGLSDTRNSLVKEFLSWRHGVKRYRGCTEHGGADLESGYNE